MEQRTQYNSIDPESDSPFMNGSDTEVEFEEKDITVSKSWSPVDVPHFVPSWEGLRGIAVLLTCVSHIDKTGTKFHHYAGSGGVSIFFVLSGFLITGVLVKQQKQYQRKPNQLTFVHLKRFYLDRMVRLYPAFIVMVVTTGSAYVYRGEAVDTKRFIMQVIYTLGYVSNFDQEAIKSKPRYIWVNTWSLSVEEQFYVLWSLALPLVLLLKTRSRVILLATLASCSFTLHVCKAAKVGPFPSWFLYNHGSLAIIWKMLLGSLARLAPLPPWLKGSKAAWSGLAILLYSYLATFSSTPIDLTSIGFHRRLFGHAVYRDLVAVLATVLVLLGTIKQGNCILDVQWLRFVGRLSYSFYLYQYPLLHFQANNGGYSGICVTALAFVVASISTIYLEEPFRDFYKSRQNRRKLRQNDVEYISVPTHP